MIARLALLALGGLTLALGVPLLWLYLASLLDSAALGVLGAAVTIVAMMPLLSAVNRGYQGARVRRGLDHTGNFPLEVTLVCSLGAAVVALAVVAVA